MNRAFSLVELSIVLVILGLLTGGILAGQSLIRAAELRAANTEYQRYLTAIGSFRDKYFALPGDFGKATDFWGTATACPGISSTPAGGTCNGTPDSTLQPAASTANELFRFWQHLAYAGLIEGTYSGTSGDTTATNYTAIVGTNIPSSKLPNSGWGAATIGLASVADTTYFDGPYGTFFFLGAQTAASLPTTINMKPEEAWNIDTKADDGKPATGKITSLESQAGTSSTTGCSDTAASAAVTLAGSNYSLGNSSIACSLMLKTGY